MRSNRLLSAVVILVSLSPCLALADSGAAAAPGQALAFAGQAQPRLATPAVLTAAVPPVRKLEIVEITGSEPDPEAFDSLALDRWWQRCLETGSVREQAESR